MSHWKMTQLCLYTFTAYLESNEIQSFFFFFLLVTICSNLSAFFCQSYQSHHLSQPEILLIVIPSSLAQSIIESVWTSRNVCCISGSLTGTWNLLRYDTAELWETGRDAECGVWKSQNGSGVFHYVG